MCVCIYIHIYIMGYDQKGRVERQRLNFKCEINLYSLILRCNAAKKKQDKTIPIKPNNPQIPIQYILIKLNYTIKYN